ncbi:MAG: hypothetical protein ACJ0BF_05160 [Gammaproteobacteria bacterium]
MNKTLFFLTALILLSCSDNQSQINVDEIVKKANAPLLKGLGNHSFKISSDIEGVQEYFDQGLIMAFAFNHAESVRSFKAAQRLDPNCAICFWGEALARGPNINVTSDGKAVMSPENRIEALKAFKIAESLKENASLKERDFIEALKTRYNGNPETSRIDLDLNYAKSMEDLYKKYPNDNDAASLYAEALMITMPWNYWAEDGNPKPDTVKVISTIERVLELDENHPLAIHLYIHAVEASSDPGRAEAAADRLGKLVPGAGHLVHMPSHIYWRVGRYKDASQANIEAAKVDEDYIAQCNAQGFYPALYYPHNIHFLWAASTMEGKSELSIESALKVSNYVSEEQIRSVPFLEFFHTPPLLSYVRFGKWQEILDYEEPIEDFKYSRSIFNYAKSVAYAATGDIEKAKQHQKLITSFLDSSEVMEMVKAGHPTKQLIEIANNLAIGSISMYQKDYLSAINNFKKAVFLQDNLPYTEPPFWYYPTRQTLGHVLLESEKPYEAIKTFKEDLEDYPKNGWSYFGLHKAYEEIGDSLNSEKSLNMFENLWEESDIKVSSSIIY